MFGIPAAWMELIIYRPVFYRHIAVCLPRETNSQVIPTRATLLMHSENNFVCHTLMCIKNNIDMNFTHNSSRQLIASYINITIIFFFICNLSCLAKSNNKSQYMYILLIPFDNLGLVQSTTC